MIFELCLPICAIFFSLLLFTVYFFKKKINLFENKMYAIMLVCVLIDSILVTIEKSLVIGKTLNNISALTVEAISIMNKLDACMLVIITTCIFLYTMFITLNLKPRTTEKLIRTTIVADFIIFILIFVLKINLIEHTPFISITGSSLIPTYIACGIYTLLSVLITLLNIRNISKKHIPLIVTILIFIFLIVVFSVNPYITIISIALTFINFIMYFTIENPDLKMLEEFHKAREYANNLNTEKSEFLFNMAGEIKTPISVINRISKEVLMQDDINVIKSKVNDIKYSSNNLLELVNKVLDINSLEKRKVSVRESKYNTTNLFKGIESQTELKLNNNLVEFRTNYDKSIPNELYGDSVRIRQIVNTLLENAIKYTKEGFIELSVNSIVKHDICRLVITVEDSGVGMTQDIVEHLFDKELEKIEEIDNPKMDLGLVKTLLDLIGGTIIVNSELNHGTKFTIVLDQKVVNHKKNKTIEAVEKYEEMYLNNKKVMCVINDETLSKKINTLFTKYQLDIEVVKLGQSCLEKVRAGEKFDLIIMEEHLEKLSSENTLAKLKSIQGFKTPVVLLTDIKDINEKEEYLKLGFTEIITLPLKKEQVEELVNNYVQEK